MKTRIVSHPLPPCTPAQAEFTWWNLWYFSPLNWPGRLPRTFLNSIQSHSPPSLPPRPYRDTGTPSLTNTNITRSHTGLFFILVKVLVFLMVGVVLMTMLS